MIRIVIVLLCIFLVHDIYAQEMSPVQNFSIDDYAAGNQNWSITQGDNKHMFFGNNKGLLEFDGGRWTLHPSPNGTIIRAVHAVKDKIYTGCYMEFGYWEPNQYGELEYVSLIEKMSEPFIDDEHIWNITSRDEWIIFQSLNRLYLYNTEESRFEVINFDTALAKIFNLGSNIYVQNKEGGLYAVQNGEVVLISSHKVFLENFIVGIYNFSNRLLIITEKGKLYFYDNDELVEWKISGIDRGQELDLYTSLQLKDEGFILGTVSNGYVYLDRTGKVLGTLNQENGLLNNTILSAFQDHDNNLWIGLDNGISAVNLASSFKVYTDFKGKLGLVYASMAFNGYLYLGTNQGLFYKKLGSGDGFRKIKNTTGQVWSLSIIDNTLFCGHNRGTFVVDEGVAKQIYDDSGTWEIKKISGTDHLLLQGNYNGLSVLEKTNGDWVFRNKIDGINISSKTFAFYDKLKIVINHEFKGLMTLEVSKDYTSVKQLNAVAPNGFDSSISGYKKGLLYTSSEGVFKFDPINMVFKRDSLLSNVFYSLKDQVKGRLVIEGDGDRVWGFSENNIIAMTPDNFDDTPRVVKIAVPQFFRRNLGLTGYENISKLYGNKFLIGTSNGYVTLNLDQVKSRDYQVLINSVFFEFRDFETESVSIKNDQEFEYNHGNLNISFAVPEYDKYTDVSFQYKLDGADKDWSKWFHETNVPLGYLPHGKYSFLVRAKIGNRVSENIANFDFRINKPWYLTNVAIILYVIGFSILVIIVHRSYLKYYRNQRAKLIQENERNMELSQLENMQEIITLRNKQLSMELDSKNRELATTAMSLINKNELLQGIKKDLLQLSDDSNKKDMVRVIDDNLSNTRDWEFFKEAFNNADQEFLNKIKSKHPSLTPNDLKFCAFLRLNLSSKEIAPLLNISVRSVEIKRYRLRKKLELQHEDNLIDYILEV